jgi:hypothetical protein
VLFLYFVFGAVLAITSGVVQNTEGAFKRSRFGTQQSTARSTFDHVGKAPSFAIKNT